MYTLSEQWGRPGGACFGVLFAFIVSVPFCGWAFSCGCDWPWRGLAAHCNYFLVEAREQCPWCVHRFFGILAVAGSVAVGAIAGGSSPAWTLRSLWVVVSVMAFLLLWARITSWIA